MEAEAVKIVERCKRVVAKFNQDLAEYIKESGSNELPDIGTSIIGSTSELDPYVVTDTEDGFDCDADGMVYHLHIKEEDGDMWLDGWNNGYDSLKDSIDFDRRRLRKAWKVWRSENPDAELEKDEDDDE